MKVVKYNGKDHINKKKFKNGIWKFGYCFGFKIVWVETL